ncbi:MAG: hypothetical protein ACPGRC_08880 [Salibacteraceae bacterium]
MNKYLSILLAIVLFGIPVYLFINQPPGESGILTFLVVFIFLPLFVFNMVARKYLIFKPYFTSPLNFMIECKKESFKYDLSKNLMFMKLLETVKESNLHLQETNEEKGVILATTSLSFKSWGENIYLTLEQKQDYTEVTVEMTTISQVSSWGKNKTNYTNLLNQFEKSLTI